MSVCRQNIANRGLGALICLDPYSWLWLRGSTRCADVPNTQLCSFAHTLPELDRRKWYCASEGK
jgi:hypothetical protein